MFVLCSKALIQGPLLHTPTNSPPLLYKMRLIKRIANFRRLYADSLDLNTKSHLSTTFCRPSENAKVANTIITCSPFYCRNNLGSRSYSSRPEMEGIEHRVVKANGINMHVAEKGKGLVILFLHGFPELWYTWRHQITAFASLGYRALAPDLRGFGETEAPDDASTPLYTWWGISLLSRMLSPPTRTRFLSWTWLGCPRCLVVVHV